MVGSGEVPAKDRDEEAARGRGGRTESDGGAGLVVRREQGGGQSSSSSREIITGLRNSTDVLPWSRVSKQF